VKSKKNIFILLDIEILLKKNYINSKRDKNEKQGVI